MLDAFPVIFASNSDEDELHLFTLDEEFAAKVRNSFMLR
jgi:hypothetical protein